MSPLECYLLKSAAVKTLRERVAAAEARTRLPRSKAEIEAGNYEKGKFFAHGMLFTIETAKGQTREGVNATTGKKWSVTMKNSYGYINRTSSAEPGDQMDFFMGPCPESEVVFVVDQNKFGTKDFDEHKCVFGCWSAAEAKELYLSNYSAGWDGYRAVTAMTIPQFRAWLKHGDMTKPAADQHITEFVKKAAGPFEALSNLLDIPGNINTATSKLPTLTDNLNKAVEEARAKIPKLETVPANLASIAQGMRIFKDLAHPAALGTAGALTGYGLGSLFSDATEQDPEEREFQRKLRLVLALSGGLAGSAYGVSVRNGILKSSSASQGRTPEELAELESEHYMDVPYAQRMLTGGILGAAGPGILSHLFDAKPASLKEALQMGALLGPLVAGAAAISEFSGRQASRHFGEKFDPKNPERHKRKLLLNFTPRLLGSIAPFATVATALRLARTNEGTKQANANANSYEEAESRYYGDSSYGRSALLGSAISGAFGAALPAVRDMGTGKYDSKDSMMGAARGALLGAVGGPAVEFLARRLVRTMAPRFDRRKWEQGKPQPSLGGHMRVSADLMALLAAQLGMLQLRREMHQNGILERHNDRSYVI